MISGGALPVDSGIYLIIGATLGTVATTLLASIGGDINGKRAACICFVLRFITSIIVVIVLAILGLNNISVGNLLYGLFGSFEFAAAIFLVIYNLIFMPLLIPFLKPSIKLAERFIKDKKHKNDFFTDRESAIIFGIPSNFIEGILVGRNYEKDKKL